MKKISEKTLILIFLILLISIFSIYAQDSSGLYPIQRPSSTSGTTTPSTSTTPTNPTNENPLSVPASAKEAERVGNKVLTNPDGKAGNPEDVTLKGGTVTPEPFKNGAPDGGKITIGGKGEVDGKKDVDLGAQGDAKIKNNEIIKAAAGSSVEFDNKAHIRKAEIKGIEPKKGEKGTEFTAAGRKNDVKITVSQDATLQKKSDTDYQLTMPKEGGKLEMPVVSKKKPEEEDKQGYDPRLFVKSLWGLTEIPNELSTKAGFSKPLSFRTIGEDSALIFSADETWRTQGKVEFAYSEKEGKSMISINNGIDNSGNKYGNANKESYLFFGEESARTPQASALRSQGIAGVIIDSGKKYISTFSTNELLSPIVKLGADNPFNGYESAMIAEGKSGISIQSINGNPEVRFLKGGIFYGGEGYSFRYQSSDFSFKKDQSITTIFPNGGVGPFQPTEGSKAKLIALDSSGNLPTEPNKRIYIDSEINNGKLSYQVYPNQPSPEPDKVSGNQPVPPSAVPVTLPKPDNNLGIQPPPDYDKLVGPETSYRTKNFIVQGPGAKAYAAALEYNRYKNAMEWTGKPMPDWSQPAVVTVHTGPHLGAGGATTFMFDKGEVYGWRMNIQGSVERLLDSVIPHETEHMVSASTFRQALPRWADEGMSTSIEYISEIEKHDRMLKQFLATGRGIAFNQMFAMSEYPADVMPLYAQAQSVTRYLLQLDGGGTVAKQKFYNFIGEGMRNNDWSSAVRKYYGFQNLGELQNSWVRSLMAKIITIFADILKQYPNINSVLIFIDFY